MRPGRARVEQRAHAVRRDAALLRLAARVDLDQRVDRAPGGRGAALERFSELAPVERVDGVEPLRDAACLVALEPADEVPARHRGARVRELAGELGSPCGRLLEV